LRHHAYSASYSGKRGLQHLLVVLVQLRETLRECEQARRLRREVQAVGVGAAHDRGQSLQRRIVQSEGGKQRVEAAKLALVA
jgi:hypothetical protein